jgi:hypothetical protein
VKGEEGDGKIKLKHRYYRYFIRHLSETRAVIARRARGTTPHVRTPNRLDGPYGCIVSACTIICWAVGDIALSIDKWDKRDN